jgi:hypothetical protein
VVLGIGVFLLAKKGGWSGVMPTIVGLGMLALTLVLLNERVVVDDDHFECTSGWIATDATSVRFSDLDNITIRSETRMRLHGPVTVYSYICNKKGGGQVVFSVTGMMSKAQPQIVTNPQKKGVKLIGFEQLQQWRHGEGGALARQALLVGRVRRAAGARSCIVSGEALTMSTYPSSEESLARLHAAGWSVGEVRAGSSWIVSGANGDIGQPYCLLGQVCPGSRFLEKVSGCKRRVVSHCRVPRPSQETEQTLPTAVAGVGRCHARH